MVTRFPELRAAYDEEAQIGSGEDTGPLVFYSLVFWPFAEDAIAIADVGLMERIASFAEELLDNSDKDYYVVGTTCIAEHLGAMPTLRERLRPFLGPRLLELSVDDDKCRTINRMLRSRFPEFEKAYIQATANGLFESNLPALVSDQVLVPLLHRALEDGNDAVIARVADFAEELLGNPDD